MPNTATAPAPPAPPLLANYPTGVTDTLLVSDVHLGLPNSRAGDLLRVLHGWRFKRLILLGDIFHDLNFNRLGGDAWALLSCVRKLSNPKRGVEVVWVVGNHDRKLVEVMAHLVGVTVHDSFEWSEHGRRYLAVHGDRFDRFLSKNVVLSRLCVAAYDVCRRWLPPMGGCLDALDRYHSAWLRLNDEVASGASRHAVERRADVVFCGHTHEALRRSVDAGGGRVEYVNTGCWVQSPATFVTVDRAGARINAVP